MAKITIREVDSTNPGVSATNPDVAYVPGYAIKGPVNTPTLCENLSTFQNLFGVRPYVFKQAQAYPSDFDSKAKPKKVMYEEDDYEKSYIYACELLSLGLPVIFERILPEQEIAGVTYTSEDLTAKIYFTKESFIIPADEAFGTHEVTEGQDTVDMPNIYEDDNGDLVYYNSTEGETEKIVLIISAPYPGSIYTQVSVSYNSIIEDGATSSSYDQFTITPTSDIATNPEPEIINFTCNKDHVDLSVPEQIHYYKNIESKYVKFEWLEDLDATFGYIVPKDITVVGSYFWNGGVAPESVPAVNKLSTYIDAPATGTSLFNRFYLYTPARLYGVTPATTNVNGTNCNVYYDKDSDKYLIIAPSTANSFTKDKVYECEVNSFAYPDGLNINIVSGFTAKADAEITTMTKAQAEALPRGYYGANSKVIYDVDFTGLSQQMLQGIKIDFESETAINVMKLFLTPANRGAYPGATATQVPTRLGIFALNSTTGKYTRIARIDDLLMNASNEAVTESYFNQERDITFPDNYLTSSIIISMIEPSETVGQWAYFINGIKFTYVNNTFDNSKTKESDLYLPEIFETHDEFTVEGLYETFTQRDFFNKEGRLTDKGEYQIKYLTSGAYPVFEYSNNLVADNFLACAAERGDCVAIIDHTNNVKRAIIPDGSSTVFDVASEYFKDKNPTAIYGTMFTPWYRCNCGSVGQTLEMPASLAYLTAFAQSLKNYPNFLATAGAVRGVVPNFVSPCQLITNALADSYQPRNNVSINAITNIKPYGNLIWGNRTLKNNAVAGNLTAQSFLNVRNMSSDIKKVVYTTSKSLTFEQNSDITWGNFKAKIVPTLDKLQAGNGISGYQILKLKTTEKAKIVALIRIFPIEPVEDFDITIELSDAGVSIS